MSKRSLMPAKVYYESGIAAAEAGMGRKQIAGLESWSSASRQDGSNFRSNLVTLAEYPDSGAVGSAGVLGVAARSEERRGGREGVSKCRFRWSPHHKKNKKKNQTTR